MNGRSYEGLSETGLVAHIANAISLWRQVPKISTDNDCKLVIAHAVRAYQKLRYPASRGLPSTVAAREKLLAREPAIREHAVPVGCVLNALMKLVDPHDVGAARAMVLEILETSTVLAWVTKEEHAQLSQDTMPKGFSSYPWADVWARYHDAKVDIPVEPLLTRRKT
jgi:hypothetical protein